jgi:phospholipid-transporting ATPase
MDVERMSSLSSLNTEAMAGTDREDVSAASSGGDKAPGTEGAADEFERKFFVNVPPIEGEHRDEFVDNKVVTAKYTPLNFVFLTLKEQFMRLANVYFLAISLMQQIEGISPTGRYTTALPLLAVLAVTAIKELYEDIFRHKQDREANARLVLVLDHETEEFVERKWQDLQVGDILRIRSLEPVPADVIVISSSEPLGTCYIETASLDGETNLKIRQALKECSTVATDPEDLSEWSAIIECEGPNDRLYQFEGNMVDPDTGVRAALGPNQMLLRGSTLRNTKWAHCIVIYSGVDTKYMKNGQKKKIKRTGIDRLTNYNVIAMFFVMLTLATICAVVAALFNSTESVRQMWYLEIPDVDFVSVLFDVMTFVILLNNLIPISLYVTVEFVKFFQARLIDHDPKMYHGETETFAKARTSNLNEELGQIEYVFSDKTGTLTENLMVFKRFSAGGILYGDDIDEDQEPVRSSSKPDHTTEQCQFVDFQSEELKDNLQDDAYSPLLKAFFRNLSVCHTVVPERQDGDMESAPVYQAASPDEGALVEAAKHLGFYFFARTPDKVTVRVRLPGDDDETVEEYGLIALLDFTSKRKRMSVIVRCPDGKIRLLCKGADTVVLERLTKDESKLLHTPEGKSVVDETLAQLTELAARGLRTLCIAEAELDEDELDEWLGVFHEANTAPSNREARVEAACELIEKDLVLIGCTAIEDKLQRGVPKAIQTLLDAGVKLWVLTGDKQETAINIGFSCQLLQPDMEVIMVNVDLKEPDDLQRKDCKRQLRRLCRKHIGESTAKFDQQGSFATDSRKALIIDGKSLIYALEPKTLEMFLRLGQQCHSVICCRVSPRQKAEVVEMVRKHLKATTLSIGDGANDVPMILAAHVGIGISGREGQQAAQSSDYSIAQFRFLIRLMLLHGRWNYRRISKVIAYSFYKNIVLYVCQFWFTLYTGISGQPLYDRWALATFNVLFTFFPIMFFGFMDRDVSEEAILKYPSLYRGGILGQHMNFKVLGGWLADALVHSFLCFFIPMLAFSEGGMTMRSDGKTADLDYFGAVCYTLILLTVTFRLALETYRWTWVNMVVMAVSVLLWLVFLGTYGTFYGWVPPAWRSSLGANLYLVIEEVFSSGPAWFLMIAVPVIALLRNYSWKAFARSSGRLVKNYHIVQELERMAPEDQEEMIERGESPGNKASLNRRASVVNARALGRRKKKGDVDAFRVAFTGPTFAQPLLGAGAAGTHTGFAFAADDAVLINTYDVVGSHSRTSLTPTVTEMGSEILGGGRHHLKMTRSLTSERLRELRDRDSNDF